MSSGDRARRRITLLILLSAAAVVLVIGWRLLWFLTDDAYISFRYVSNSIFGHGYVWNAPPFRPVEGYTNFLWVALLDLVWRAFGAEPPVSANYISLVFSFLTVAVISSMALGMKWSKQAGPHRMLLLGLLLTGIVTNRTFLTWSSSGLETAMFNFFLIVWVKSCIQRHSSARWFILSLTCSAIGLYLTRPDGALFLAATGLILLLAFRRGVLGLSPSHVAGMLPLLAMPAHMVWRVATYGEWLPNSYYAKFTGPWPESGMRYALSFSFEYGMWVWLALLIYVLYRAASGRVGPGRRTRAGSEGEEGRAKRDPVMPLRWGVPRVVCAALAIHALYYTFVIGGDHFEYRVYSHLVPLAFLSFVWMLSRVNIRPGFAVMLLAVFILMSWPIPWAHWASTRALNSREETHKLFVRVSDGWPSPVRWYAEIFDSQQEWLVEHYVCTRHQEHKINCEFLKSIFPARADGLRLPSADYPVFSFGAVGVVSWVMPKINIIDIHGINDYVIARSPVDPGMTRMMGHDRLPPPGYAECFRPNVELYPGREVVVRRRQRELTAEDIIACEQRWAEIVKRK